MDLTDQLNMGKVILPIKDYQGPIPLIVPAIREDGRIVAGGNLVFKERLEALQSGDKERINGWGNNHFDLSDACIVDSKGDYAIQPTSGFLTGIQGVVQTNDGLYVAIDADSVESALQEGGRQYFEAVDATAGYLHQGKTKTHDVKKVVLLPYDGISMKLTDFQAGALNTNWLERKYVNRDLQRDEIAKSGWQAYPAEVIDALADIVFEYNKRTYNYDKNMCLWLPSEPKEGAELRALYVNRLGDRSRLCSNYGLGDDGGRLLGVVDGAEGAAKK